MVNYDLIFFSLFCQMHEDLPEPTEVQIPQASFNTVDFTPAQIAFTLFEDNVYMMNKKHFMYLSTQEMKWIEIAPLPFSERMGQSMTTTPHGIAFFGGKEGSSSFYNDLWLYNNNDWSYVTCDIISERAFHAAEWDNKTNSLIICGGQNLNSIFDDIYLVDIKTQKVSRIVIPGIPKFRDHTITSLPDGTFCLFGGWYRTPDLYHDQQNSSLYILNPVQLSFAKIETDFENAGFFSHFASYIYGMLFIFGSQVDTYPKKKIGDQDVPIRIAWMFDFNHRTWIPLDLPSPSERCQVSPIFIFTSMKLSNHKSLHVIDDCFSKLIEFPVFSETPPENIQNHPQFIKFMRKNLEYASKFYKDYKTPLDSDIKIKLKTLEDTRNSFIQTVSTKGVLNDVEAKNIFELSDNIRRIGNSISVAEKLYRCIQRSPGYNTYNQQPPSNDSIHNIVLELHKMNEKFQNEIKPLDDEAQKLSQQIEQATFFKMNESFNPQTYIPVKSLAEYERLRENSKQLAQEIVYEKGKLKTESSNISSQSKQKKETIMNIYDQLWGITKRETEILTDKYKTQIEFYKALIGLTQTRDKELTFDDQNARKSAEQVLTIPQKTEKIQYVQDDLTDYLQELDDVMDDLDSNKASHHQATFAQKLANLKKALGCFETWTKDAKKRLGIQNLTGMNLNADETRRKSIRIARQRKSTSLSRNEYYSRPFESNVGSQREFLSDLEDTLNELERGLESFL